MRIFDHDSASTPSGDPAKAIAATWRAGRFVFDDGEPIKDTFIYVTTPGQDAFELENRWKTNDKGHGGRLLANAEYRVYYDAERRDAKWLEKNITEDHCYKVQAGAPKSGVIEVKLARPKFEVEVNGSTDPKKHYLGWTPAKCALKQTTKDVPTLRVMLRYDFKGTGRLSFYFGTDRVDATRAPVDAQERDLPKGEESLPFFMGGKFGHPSKVRTPKLADPESDKDTTLEVVCHGAVVAKVPLFVRVRKNANKISPAEQQRWLNAMLAINQSGAFDPFRHMHIQASHYEAHSRQGFLAWHRAYLVDLERELQTVDPSVCIPYWKFDEKAENVFSATFMGKPVKDEEGGWDPQPVFEPKPGHPLLKWRTYVDPQVSATQGPAGVIDRQPQGWDPTTQTGKASYPPFKTDKETLDHGKDGVFLLFEYMQGNPHGVAHSGLFTKASFLHATATAPRDPLFFMLHCNVDRLWAMWQKTHMNYDGDEMGNAQSTRVGHRANDTMWPWNGVTGAGGEEDRPSFAPGGKLPDSPLSAELFGPGPEPKCKDVFDYQGRRDPYKPMGFDYEDVAYA